jgi:hypothetical protein
VSVVSVPVAGLVSWAHPVASAPVALVPVSVLAVGVRG